MAANINPIFPVTPYMVSANLSAVTACTTRAPTLTANLAAANIVQLTTTSTNGRRVDRITVYASSTSMTAPTASQLVGIWAWDGTTAYLVDEIVVSVVTPSTTVTAYSGSKTYDDFVMPAAFKLYVSTTVTTTAATTALTVTLYGGDY